MRTSSPALRSGALILLVMTTGVSAQQHPQIPGAIRSEIVLVPIDVRVLDKDGNPVTDLTQADFTVLEDGRSQQIGHFSTLAFGVAFGAALADAPVLRRGPGLEASPVTRRTFLIVLGRGRLQHPARGLDAVRTFLQTRALPQDLIAVQAYGRITDFPTDRAPLLRLIDGEARTAGSVAGSLVFGPMDPRSGGLAWNRAEDCGVLHGSWNAAGAARPTV